MRTRIRLVVVAILASLAARPVHATTFMAGFKGGFALADVTGLDQDTSLRNTFVLGGIASWETCPWFAFDLEPSFTGKGVELDAVPNSALMLTYFDLPLLAKFKKRLDPTARTGFFGTIGPVVGINTQSTLRISGAEDTAGSQIKDFDLGVGVGAGFDWDFHEGGIVSFEARFVGGVLDMTTDNAKPIIDQTAHNLSFQLTAGWFKHVF